MDGNLEIWRWLASALLAVLGWLIGRKDLVSNKTQERADKECTWEISKEAVLLRIKQLEDLTNLRSEHPEFHPLANYVNTFLGKADIRIERIERHCFGDKDDRA